MSHTKKLLAAAFCCLGLALAACGGSNVCSDKGKCANDTAPSQADVDACNAIISDADCGSQAKAYGECVENNETCDASGNNAGPGTACDSQATAFASCCQAHPSGAACAQ